MIDVTASLLSGRMSRALDETDCRHWLRHATENVSAPDEAEDLNWLLAHCDDGVVWGVRADGRWLLSNAEYPEVSPLPTEMNVQQLRMFGPHRELLIWRSDTGLKARELSDLSISPHDEALNTRDEKWVLLGDDVVNAFESESAVTVSRQFTLVGDRRGARHAVPWNLRSADFGSGSERRWPLRLVVRHYFTSDDAGVVRIVASRLVNLELDQESRS